MVTDLQTLMGNALAWLGQPLIRLGSSSISLGTLMGGLAFFVGVWWLASFVERILIRVADRRAREVGGSASIHMLSRVVRYLIWIVGSVVGLNAVGFDLTTLALLGSALAVGLGFGLQNIFANFVGGVVILAERILKVGDFVELESGVRGHVKEIAMRYTRITTNDAIDILVPNAEFTDGRVINWTYDNAFRRVRVPFGVAYGVRKEAVLEAGIAAARAVDGVLTQPGREPTVWLVAYGDNAMNYELVVWADRDLTTRPGSTHARLMWALDTELVQRGLEIPFPQRDLHIRSGTLDVRLQGRDVPEVPEVPQAYKAAPRP
jgi:small-conductance mechanosensitive channel